MKKTVLLLCGGRSKEHQVSLRSGLSVINQFPLDRYQRLPVAVDRQGKWFTGDPLILNPDDPKNIQIAPKLQEVQLEGDQVGGQKIDCVFSVLHGRFGEDGCMQGVFEMAGIPQVGSGVLGSSIAMDKDVTKRLVIQEGIKTAPYLCLRASDPTWPCYEEAAQQLGGALFVKPASQGSSLGISKVTQPGQYKKALKEAFLFDHKVLVEQAIVGLEIEIAVLGNQDLVISVPGEIQIAETFYSYEAKYILNNTRLVIPAPLPEPLALRLQEIAKRVFICLELRGMARIDFFVDRQEQIWLNEPNTLPGFTSISMYAKLFAASGIPYEELLTRLIHLALETGQTRRRAP